MNEVFNINRFIHFLKQNLVFARGTYLYMLATVVASVIVGAGFYIYFGYSIAKVILAGVTLTIAFGPCFFEKKITRYNGVFDFTFPVSTLEKLLALLVKYLIFIPVLLFGSLYLLISFFKVIPWEELQDFAYSFTFNSFHFKEGYSILVFVSSFLLGYLSFKKNAFAKTWLVFIISSFVTSTLFICFLYLTIGQTSTSSGMFDNMGDAEINTIKAVFNYTILDYIMVSFIPLGLWIVSYFKIREKEI